MRASDLKKVIIQAIRKLKAINLKVVALITDMGSNFYKLFQLLNIDIEHSYFEIDGDKIFFIFDPFHLIKATRNNLYHHSFVYNDKCTSWKLSYFCTFCNEGVRFKKSNYTSNTEIESH